MKTKRKTYGEGSIKRLRDNGYSPRAIEDITFVSEKYRAKPHKVESLFNQGYNINQISEIYGTTREMKFLSPNKIQEFYDIFKPEKRKLYESLANAIEKMPSERPLYNPIYKDRPINNDLDVHDKLDILNKYGKKHNTSLEGTIEGLLLKWEMEKEKIEKWKAEDAQRKYGPFEDPREQDENLFETILGYS